MLTRPPISNRTDTLVPCTTLFLSRRFLLHLENRADPLDRDEGDEAQYAGNQESQRLIRFEQRRNAPHRQEKKRDFRCGKRGKPGQPVFQRRSEEHTSELQSLMRISYAVFCLKKKKIKR